MLLCYGFHLTGSHHGSFALLSAFFFSPLLTFGGQPGLPGICYSFLLQIEFIVGFMVLHLHFVEQLFRALFYIVYGRL